MSDSIYLLYQEATINLARSLVIKSTSVANAINRELTLLGEDVDVSLPHSWKYYLNLNGQYHETDTPMEVVSLDTLEIIPFTRESLDIHRSTRKAYAFNSSQYISLLDKFPEQELLIKGIVDPVDIDEAINAKDFTIIHYEPSLVESNEIDLITRLQDWLYGFMARWHVSAYEFTDDLYMASAWATMIVNVPNTILNIRLDNCRTPRVHSYHIWTYLRSNAALAQYRSTLTTTQALFLYRNIRYILNNSGKTETFELLIKRMLTDRGFAIYGYDLRHGLERQPDETRPDIEMLRYPLDTALVDVRVNRIREVEEVLRDTATLAKDNGQYIPEIAQQIIEDTQRSGKNNIQTKVVESIVSSNKDLSDITLEELLVEHWAYLSSINVYVANLNVLNPVTGEVLQLNPNDAFILYLYVFNASFGVILEDIPTFTTQRIVRDTNVSFKDITSGLDYEVVGPFKELYESIPGVGTIINPDSFYEHVEIIHHVVSTLVNSAKHAETMEGRAHIRELLHRITQTHDFSLSPTVKYSDWFLSNDIDIANISTVDAAELYVLLYKTATGLLGRLSISPEEIQRDLIAIMDALTSYDVQFIKTLVGENAFILDANKARVGKTWGKLKQDAGGLDTTLRIQRQFTSINAGRENGQIGTLKLTDNTKSYEKLTLVNASPIVTQSGIRQNIGSVRIPSITLVQKETI